MIINGAATNGMTANGALAAIPFPERSALAATIAVSAAPMQTALTSMIAPTT
jgi:hypothetical protein